MSQKAKLQHAFVKWHNRQPNSFQISIDDVLSVEFHIWHEDTYCGVPIVTYSVDVGSITKRSRKDFESAIQQYKLALVQHEVAMLRFDQKMERHKRELAANESDVTYGLRRIIGEPSQPSRPRQPEIKDFVSYTQETYETRGSQISCVCPSGDYKGLDKGDVRKFKPLTESVKIGLLESDVSTINHLVSVKPDFNRLPNSLEVANEAALKDLQARGVQYAKNLIITNVEVDVEPVHVTTYLLRFSVEVSREDGKRSKIFMAHVSQGGGGELILDCEEPPLFTATHERYLLKWRVATYFFLAFGVASIWWYSHDTKDQTEKRIAPAPAVASSVANPASGNSIAKVSQPAPSIMENEAKRSSAALIYEPFVDSYVVGGESILQYEERRHIAEKLAKMSRDMDVTPHVLIINSLGGKDIKEVAAKYLGRQNSPDTNGMFCDIVVLYVTGEARVFVKSTSQRFEWLSDEALMEVQGDFERWQTNHGLKAAMRELPNRLIDVISRSKAMYENALP